MRFILHNPTGVSSYISRMWLEDRRASPSDGKNSLACCRSCRSSVSAETCSMIQGQGRSVLMNDGDLQHAKNRLVVKQELSYALLRARGK